MRKTSAGAAKLRKCLSCNAKCNQQSELDVSIDWSYMAGDRRQLMLGFPSASAHSVVLVQVTFCTQCGVGTG